MSQERSQREIQEQTQQLLHGPLKHIRAAALAAALLPLASVAATPVSAQEACPSGGLGICGVVWDDQNNNGVRDTGEPGIEGAQVYLSDGTDTLQVDTGPDGFYFFEVPDGTYSVAVLIEAGTQASPPNVSVNNPLGDSADSDGTPDGAGFSVATNVPFNLATDFGFHTSAVQQPGTGTPGYWKNHPDAWPVDEITVGGVTYTKDEAIAWLKKVGKDKTTTMFSSLVPAMLNVLILNDSSCVADAIDDANAWMATYGPVGSSVAASSAEWSLGEPIHRHLDNYNNGRLCAPHRD
jgi:hypothetical protein